MQVSWHWKWLCEHDVVWKPKCLKRGWDYGKPEPPYERAVWKRYVQILCRVHFYTPIYFRHLYTIHTYVLYIPTSTFLH